MNEAISNDMGMEIQWVDKKEEKVIVKFKSIKVPVEMNSGYYNSQIKPLCN